MFLRCHSRKKNGKPHHYWSVVESRRCAGGRVVQRQVLYLGEINDSQEAAWRKTIRIFDEQNQDYRQMALFPADRPLPPDEANALSVKLTEMQLHRPRSFGDCWLGYLLWEELGLDWFWNAKLGCERGEVPWAKVLCILVINRLCDPGSEFAVHRRWFLKSALDELLNVDYSAAAKDRLYRCLDHILPHKEALCQHLTERWRTLFDARYDVLLYDLTSTYFEGACEGIPKAKHGYSRDGRPDCRQVVIALVVTPRGLPLDFEVMAGNTSDKTTLKGFMAKIESMYGQARRVWVMDRGIPTEASLEQMRREGMAYLVGTPKAMLGKLEQELLHSPWRTVHEGMDVRLVEKDGELYIEAHSSSRQSKENAMRRRKLKALVHGLNRLRPWRRKTGISRDQLLRRVAVLKKEAGRVSSFVRVREPAAGEAVTRETFVCEFDRAAWRTAWDRDGHYILRAFIPWDDAVPGMEKTPESLWSWYMQLVHVEEAFKSLKSDLDLRPIHHQLQRRVEAHILVAFLGYCLSVTLRMKLETAAPGLTSRAVLESLAAVQMLDVVVPTTDGRELVLRRHTEPEMEQAMILEKLKLELPAQPPPRIRAQSIALPARGAK
jgi:transposase